jgi:membrane-associated phospholipid phosphatase
MKCPKNPSFPSEHSAAAFAAAFTLSRIDRRLRPMLVPSAVTASRVRVNVHHPSDVIAGAALGVFVSRAVAPYFEPLH